jgi:hypothetical protein
MFGKSTARINKGTVMAICAHPVVLTAQIAASLGVGFAVQQQLGRPVFSVQCANPTYDQSGCSFRELHICGVTVTLNRKFTGDFEIRAGYVHSKTIDDGSFDWPP